MNKLKKIIGGIVIFLALLLVYLVVPVKTEAAAPCKNDSTHFCDTYDNHWHIGDKLFANFCGRSEWPSFAKRGGGSHRGVIDDPSCTDDGIRHYPRYNGSYKMPALITFWMYLDADSYAICCTDRFSQSTIKEQGAGGNYLVARIFTTHVDGQGRLDCGHCVMSFRSNTIKFPLKQWHLQSHYVENKTVNGKLETHVTIFYDNKEAVRGVVNNTFYEGIIRTWHMGMYADRSGGPGAFSVYNDELKIFSVNSKSEALSLVSQELGGGPLPTDPPTLTPTKKPGESPTPTKTPTPIISGTPSTKFKIGERVETTETLNVKSSPGEGTLGTQPPGVQGTVLDGPGLGVGGAYWWWEIDYDAGVDGWSSEDSLKKVGSATSTLKPTKTPTPIGTGTSNEGDLDGDGDVDIFDYNIVVGNFGAKN